MSKVFAVLLLVATVAGAGIRPCPQAMRSCSTAKQIGHDCCGARTALRAVDCCCPNRVQEATPLLSTAAQHDHLPAKVLVASAVYLDSPTTAATPPGLRWDRPDHGLAPPGTLVTQHTALLL